MLQLLHSFADRTAIPSQLTLGQPLAAFAQRLNRSRHKYPTSTALEILGRIQEQRFDHIGQFHRHPSKKAFPRAIYHIWDDLVFDSPLDQDAVRSGAAARGEPWKYYDLGHGYCLNDFWAECKHRMACARCPFYRPKESLKDQLLEGQANLLHMLEFVQLTEEEKLLVTEGIELHQTLIEQLADTPTPAGPTPRELAARRQDETKIIPLESIGRNSAASEQSKSQKKQRIPRSHNKKEQEKRGNTSERQ